MQGADGLRARALGAGRGGAALGVVGVAFLAPSHREAVDLAPLHDERDGLGRLAERDREQARRERVERAGVAGALGLEYTLHHAHRMGGRHAHGLVEHEPAVHVALLALALRLPGRVHGGGLRQLLVIRLVVEIAPHRGRSQKLLDSFGFVESLVERKPDLRCEFQVNAPRDLAAQVPLVALERGDHVVLVAAAERHHVDGGEPQIRGHAHLGHGDEMAFDHGIMHLTAREQLGQRVADELADAQLALGGHMARAGIALMMSAGHDRPECCSDHVPRA